MIDQSVLSNRTISTGSWWCLSISRRAYRRATAVAMEVLVAASDRVAALPVGEPLRLTMVRLAVGLKVSAMTFVLIAALLAVPPAGNTGIRAGLLGLLTGWTAAYAVLAVRYRLPSWLIACDAAVAGLLCLLMGEVATARTLAGGAGWVGVYSSMAVICAQFGALPLVSVPAGLAVAGSYLAGATRAGMPGTVETTILIVQVVLTALVMVAVRRAGRDGDRSFDAYHAAVRRDAVDRARRQAELQYLRLLHNGPLTTLTMAGSWDLGGRTVDMLRQRAALDVTSVREATRGGDDAGRPVRLDWRLSLIVGTYEPPLTVSLQLVPCTIHGAVAEALVAACAEALENVVRHAGTKHAVVRLTSEPIMISVTDNGAGFDLDAVPPHKLGIREAVVGQMAAVGGWARVRSAPGRGTSVRIGWPR
jgi:hypothetical protein